MTSKLTRLTDDELTETLRLATSGYPLPACVEGNLRQAFAELQERRKAAMDSEPVAWLNGCNKSVPAALRYLAENPRPIGGESSFNTVHLYQLAREIELMAEAPLYRHAQPAPELTAIVERLNASGYEYEGGEVTPKNAAAVVDILLQQLDDAVQGRDAQPAPVVPEGLNIRAVAALREAVRNQWLKSDELADMIYWKSMHDIANEIIGAMLAAAPQEVK